MTTYAAAPAARKLERPISDPAPSTHGRRPLPQKTTRFQESRRIAQFHRRLQRRFLYRDADARSFLLVALRLQDGGPASAALPFTRLLYDSLRKTIGPKDTLLCVPSCGRAVLLLENRTADEAAPFLDALSRQLPAPARPHFQNLEILIAPEGQPYQRAEAFLAYALCMPLSRVSH